MRPQPSCRLPSIPSSPPTRDKPRRAFRGSRGNHCDDCPCPGTPGGDRRAARVARRRRVDDTTVDVNTGMIAAGRLQALIESRASGTSIADLMVQMDRIIRVIHSTVPEDLWPEILRKIDGPVAADTPADEIEDWDDGEDEYDPVESAQADEDCWTPSARTAGRDDREGGTHHRGGALHGAAGDDAYCAS